VLRGEPRVKAKCHGDELPGAGAQRRSRARKGTTRPWAARPFRRSRRANIRKHSPARNRLPGSSLNLHDVEFNRLDSDRRGRSMMAHPARERAVLAAASAHRADPFQ
jgi:hypothetical protein